MAVPSLDTSIVEVGSEEHPERKARTAKARSDILDSICVCYMIELITLSSLPQAPFVAMIHPPKIGPGKGWYSIDEGVIALNRKRRRCSPSTTVTS